MCVCGGGGGGVCECLCVWGCVWLFLASRAPGIKIANYKFQERGKSTDFECKGEGKVTVELHPHSHCSSISLYNNSIILYTCRLIVYIIIL